MKIIFMIFGAYNVLSEKCELNSNPAIQSGIGYHVLFMQKKGDNQLPHTHFFLFILVFIDCNEPITTH